MFPTHIPIPIPGGLEMPLPRFVTAEQRFNDAEEKDPAGSVARQFAPYRDRVAGKSVAVAVGSRGIRSQPPVVKAVIEQLKAAGAHPFLIPAMGSHGGGNAAGQQKILEDYGMGEAEMGVPVRSSLDVVELTRIDGDLPIYCDRLAHEADFIVPVNRVKPHTSFRGKWESGLCKMLAIGVSKHAGATAMHQRGFGRFAELVPAAAEAFLAHGNVLFSVAIVENGYDHLHTVELVGPADTLARDAALLEVAKANIPQFLLRQIDVLIIDEAGKNISGAGMDPNVTGRTGSGEAGFTVPTAIHRIVIRGLTAETHGNATGTGMADIVTQRFAQAVDWTKTYVNHVTSGVPGGARLPMVANTDQEAIWIALRCCPMITPETAKIVRIASTLDLDRIWISEALAAEAEAHADMAVTSAPFDMRFDAHGALGQLHDPAVAAE